MKKVELRLKLELELRKEFHAACIRAGYTMSDVIEGYILDYIKNHDSRQPNQG